MHTRYLSFFINNQTILFVDSKTEKNSLKKIIKSYSPDYIWMPHSEKKKSYKNYTEDFNYLSFILLKRKKNNNTIIKKKFMLFSANFRFDRKPKVSQTNI